MSIDEEKNKARSTIMQLSDLLDPIGLRTYIVNKTKYGKKPGPEPWHYTRAALSEYAPSLDAEKVIQLFRDVGCKDDISAVRWLLRYDELIP